MGIAIVREDRASRARMVKKNSIVIVGLECDGGQIVEL